MDDIIDEYPIRSVQRQNKPNNRFNRIYTQIIQPIKVQTEKVKSNFRFYSLTLFYHPYQIAYTQQYYMIDFHSNHKTPSSDSSNNIYYII